jgi:zinc transport system substrate-binding protein
MKARLAIVAASVLLASALAFPSPSSPALARAQTTATDHPEDRPLRVLCSVFPVYLFTKHVAADTPLQVDLMLPPNLGCPHDYALTPQDMQKIALADLLVVNGQGLEEFLGEPVTRANPKIRVIDASAGVKDLIEMADEDEEEGHPEGSREEKGHHHHAGPNPHLFASPRMAAWMVQTIAGELEKADPRHAHLYARNAKEYADRLVKLAEEFAETVKTLKSKKIVTEHAAFDYLARDCGLQIVAVVEETPGQEPSAAQMLEIVERIKATGAAAVFTEPQYPAKVGQTIARQAKVPVATLDPVASGPADAGLDYYEKVMRANLETLKKVLGEKNN